MSEQPAVPVAAPTEPAPTTGTTTTNAAATTWLAAGGLILAFGFIASVISIINASMSINAINIFMGNESEKQLEAMIALIYACAWAGLAAVGGILIAVSYLARKARK